MRILFLYTRLADYFLQSAKSVLSENPNSELLFITKPFDGNAPYEFKVDSERLKILSINDFSTKEDLKNYCFSYAADIVYSAGWGDIDYRFIAKEYRSRQKPVIIGLDNLWKNSFSQKLKSYLLAHQIRKLYSHIWVPGPEQYHFAKQLGFEANNILSSLYVGDLLNYTIEEDAFAEKLVSYPKKLIYFGRLVEYKFVHGLVRAYNSIDPEFRNGWTLEIIGRGDLKKQLIVDAGEGISFRDFMQPADLASLVKSSGAYCLPSHFEHWGVAMHEAAAAGLPIISSDTVGASSSFCLSGYNGYTFSSRDVGSLEKQLRKLFSKSKSDLVEMGKKSRKLALGLSHDDWRASLMSVVHE